MYFPLIEKRRFHLGAFDVMIFFAIGDREKDVIADDTYYLKEKALLCQSIF